MVLNPPCGPTINLATQNFFSLKSKLSKCRIEDGNCFGSSQPSVPCYHLCESPNSDQFLGLYGFMLASEYFWALKFYNWTWVYPAVLIGVIVDTLSTGCKEFLATPNNPD